MLKITRLADYAVLILCCFNANTRRSLSAPKIASLTGISIATVNKILSILLKSQILKSSRGVYGGYTPSRKLADISIKDLIEAIEGPVAITECIKSEKNNCNLFDTCITKKTWGLVNRAVKDTLHNIKIEDINNGFLNINNNKTSNERILR